MYQQHWGLTKSPFVASYDARHFFAGATHNEALARLQFLVEGSRRLGILLGATGLGKSLLLDEFAQQLTESGHGASRLNLMGVAADEFPQLLAESLNLHLRDASPAALWRRIADRVAEYRYLQRACVFLFDDVDAAAPEVIDSVTRLIYLDTTPGAQLTTVLAANPQGTPRLGNRLLQLADLRIDLEAFSAVETGEYLQSALQYAGRAASVFTSDAVTMIHQISGGVPRRINQLAELTLLAGAGARLTEIDATTVNAVHHELDVHQPETVIV